jgi:transcription-repair coupling factor (superfamily II helicase)
LTGLSQSYLALLLAALRDADDRPIIIVTTDESQAQQLSDDLTFFIGESEIKKESAAPSLLQKRVFYLPSVSSSPYSEISPDKVAVMRRQAVLYALGRSDSPPIVVLAAESLRRKVLAPALFQEHCHSYRVGDFVDREELIRQLIAGGYSRTPVVEDPGTFALRGGIVDIFVPLGRFPQRLEFFGDEIESIRLFDSASQRTLRAVKSLWIHPASEVIRSPEVDIRAVIRAAADKAQVPSRTTRMILEAIEQGREFLGIEALTPAFSELVSLTSYWDESALWVLLDPAAISERFAVEEERALAAFEARKEEQRITFEPDAYFDTQDNLQRSWQAAQRLEIGASAAASLPSLELSQGDNAELAAELRRAKSDKGEEVLDTLEKWLDACKAKGRQVIIAGGGEAQLQRLDALLSSREIDFELKEDLGALNLLSESDATGTLWLQAGHLSSGIRHSEGSILLSAEEIFGPRLRQRAAAKVAGMSVGDLRRLALDELIVHSQHGIGRYKGLTKLAVQGGKADFLHLEYAGGDRLYVPVYRMNLVQRYVGGEKGQAKLDKLGGTSWATKQKRAAGEVRKLGEELLQLYAQRQALAGHAFDSPDSAYSEFEASFPFEETPDQLRAVGDVIEDMTGPRPMDRLICGDVGFGKTEVALRAAFLAAMSGKQVALLAPTTVLVEQHYRTFSDRFRAHPMRVEVVSRFRPRKEITRVLEDLTRGQVDVIIGTHRLLSADVQFSDLGLLIIDEEQRFGVTHKERLKRFRTQVDVLTLTATPIPRTLQMGMVGLREISIISTPPQDRLAVRTFVSRFEEPLIKDAVKRELARGGQVFFVHNRVENIDRFAEHIAGLLPDCRIAVAHGQMDSRNLERVMFDFVGGEYDILICTTIIESGLDIPRANTMFVNKGDRFGLAQLYQLRGRIGRSRHRAYCYILVDGFEKLTDEARKRLDVLQQFTQLGSGFSVASHDLEIRGAGDLLGGRQSGQIAAVGFEMYSRLLQEAVAELKGEPIQRECDPEIKTQVEAYIPDDYVEEMGQRLDLYKRLSDVARDEGAIGDLLREIADRYGPLPTEVEALGDLMIIKGLAARLGAALVELSDSRLGLTLTEKTPLSAEKALKLVADPKSRFKLHPPARLVRLLDQPGAQSPLRSGKKALRRLLAYANEPH